MIKNCLKFHVNEFLQPISLLPELIVNRVSKYNMIVLNSASVSKTLVDKVWQNCELKVCADGGGNRLYNLWNEHDRVKYIPNSIVGDLDSLGKEASDYYTSFGTVLYEDGDQAINDLDKALQWINAQTKPENLLEQAAEADVDVYADIDADADADADLTRPSRPKERPKESIVILGAQGGRFDQEMANLHALFRWKKVFDRIILLNEECSVCLLEAGYVHHIKPIPELEGPVCGLIPFNGKVDSITTKGLQWDLTSESLEMGERISSSNRVMSSTDDIAKGIGPTVTVECSGDLLWTCIHTLFPTPTQAS